MKLASMTKIRLFQDEDHLIDGYRAVTDLLTCNLSDAYVVITWHWLHVGIKGKRHIC